jgi:hypothetical protein
MYAVVHISYLTEEEALVVSTVCFILDMQGDSGRC